MEREAAVGLAGEHVAGGGIAGVDIAQASLHYRDII
jgi:hypothetical protein